MVVGSDVLACSDVARVRRVVMLGVVGIAECLWRRGWWLRCRGFVCVVGWSLDLYS